MSTIEPMSPTVNLDVNQNLALSDKNPALEHFRQNFGLAAKDFVKTSFRLKQDGMSHHLPRWGQGVASYPEQRIFYAGRRGYFLWKKSEDGFTHLLSRMDVMTHATAMLRQDAKLDGEPLSVGAQNDLMIHIQTNNDVSVYEALAGYPPGVFEDKESGKRFIVLSGPRIIKGKAAEFPFLAEYFTQLLGEDVEHPDQLLVFISHLAQARKNLVIDGQRRPLPVIVLVGPRESGKTLAINLLKRILGGREAHPYRYLSGDCKFNGDLMGAELLTIDDQATSRYENARRQLAQNIKSLLFGDSVRIEGKNVDAINVHPIQVLAIACNNEAEHLKVLPEMCGDNSIGDKISLFHCRKSELLSTLGLEEKKVKIEEELPAFIAYLETFTIPIEYSNGRTGPRAWQHSVIDRMISANGPEVGLLEMLGDYQEVREGTKFEANGEESFSNRIFNKELRACDIQEILTEKYPTRAKQVFRYSKACGEYLGRLKAQGYGIRMRGVNGRNLWTISSVEVSR